MNARNKIFSNVLFLLILISPSVQAEQIVLAVPGPGSLSYLPVYLAKAIGADQAEGMELRFRYFPGGPLAMRDLMTNNSDFLAIGLSSIASARADDQAVKAFGQLSQSAMFIVLIRSSLKSQIHSISQLKGKRIGTASNNGSQRSMGQMMIEFLLSRAGLKVNDVQFISTGQTRDAMKAALRSGTVDAIMGDEPFASELVAQGIAVRLADLYDPKKSNALLGGPVIHAALATREDMIAQHPDIVKKVRHIFDVALQWMSSHSAQEIADKIAGQPGFEIANNKPLVEILQHNKGMFPNSIDWDPKAVSTTETFFHATASGKKETDLHFTDFVSAMNIN